MTAPDRDSRIDEDRIEEEIRFHIDSRVAELMAAGHAEDQARTRALREFGDPSAARVEIARVDRAGARRRRMRGVFAEPWQEVRHVLRSLRRQPGFSAVVILTLALATGANAAVFGIIDRMLLSGPEHVQDADRVLRLYGHMESPSQGRRTTDTFGYVTYADLREGATTLESVAAYSTSSIVIGRGTGARSLTAGHATWDFFPLLGASASLGRFFSAEEDQPPRGRDVVVLDDGFWRSGFGASPDVIGQMMQIGDSEFEIIGVAPAGFTGAELSRVDVWLPMAVRGRDMRDDWPMTRHSSWLRIVARPYSGVTPERASEEVAAIHTQRASAEAPGEDRSAALLELLPLSHDRAGKPSAEAGIARWLAGVALIVLLIAIANVSSLQLARGTSRKREVAVRLALGIDRLRLVRLFLAESLVLAFAGTLLGLLVAHFGSELIRIVLLPQVAWTAPPVNQRVLVFSAMTAIIVGIAVGIAPALGASRTGITESLKTGTREGGGRTGRLRSLLLVVQPALAVVLLIGAGLFVRSLSRVRAIDLGFSPDRVLAVDVYWPAIRTVPAEDRERIQTVRDQFASEARDRLTNLPGIESAALTIGLPFHTSYGVRVRIPGRDSMPRFAGEGPGIAGVSEGYFETVGATLVRGRLFTADDLAGSEWVTVVNESMASTFWPGEDAVGQCLTLYDERIPCVRVVGIVRDMKQWSLQELPNLQYFVPIAQAREISGTLILVRPAGEPEESIARVREELVAMRADLPYVNVSTIQRRIDPQIRPWRMGAILFSVFGVLALIVAASGLYSVLAWLVEQRRHEFGVRSALGASTGRILASTIKRGVLPAVIGLAAGALMAFVSGTWLEPHLFETSARDPLVFGGAAGVLLLVAVLGALIPARRAAGVDPMVALREG